MAALSIIGWDGLTAIATTILVIVGAWQIRGIRKEAKEERTIAICNRLYAEEFIHSNMSRLTKAWLEDKYKKRPIDYFDEVACMLNYFNSVAIGIEHKLYSESLARAYLGSVLVETVETCFDPEPNNAFPLDSEYFSVLLALAKRWK